MAQARLVFIETFRSEPMSILVVNRSKEPVLGVELLDVTSSDPSFRGWQLDMAVDQPDSLPCPRRQRQWAAQGSVEIGVGVDGVKEVRDLRLAYTIGFVDANGLAWKRANNDAPERDLSGRSPRFV